jgi:hypothetical protein
MTENKIEHHLEIYVAVQRTFRMIPFQEYLKVSTSEAAARWQ